LEVLKRICEFRQTGICPKMPTPTEIIKCTLNCVKRDVLPPIVAELKAENAELKERLRILEEIVKSLMNSALTK